MSGTTNGVNVEALLGAREALTAAPEAAQFTWRASCKWINGTHSRSTVQQFFGLGEDQSHRTEFTFDADHPEIFAAEDTFILSTCWKKMRKKEDDVNSIIISAWDE